MTSTTPAVRITRNPVSLGRNPIIALLPGYSRLRVAITSGPATQSLAARAAPTSTTAAAPSPNSPLATRLSMESSSRCTVSEQSSTETSSATSSGAPSR